VERMYAPWRLEFSNATSNAYPGPPGSPFTAPHTPSDFAVSESTTPRGKKFIQWPKSHPVLVVLRNLGASTDSGSPALRV
jgi:hypothetical protein